MEKTPETIALEKAAADAKSEAETLKAKLEALEKSVTDSKTAAETAAETAKVALEKAAAEKATLEKALADAKEASEVGEAISKAATEFKNLPAKAEDLGPALRLLRKADATATEKLESILKSVNVMLEKTLEPKGKSTGDSLTAWEQIQKSAAALVAADPKLTTEAAVDRVLTANPDLYTAHQAEKQGK